MEFSRNRKKGSVWLKCDGEGHIGRQWGWRGELSFQNATLAMCFHIVYGYMDATRAELSNILGWPKSSFGFSMLWKNLNKKNPSELFGQPQYVVVGMVSGFAGLHIKLILLMESLAIAKNWLPCSAIFLGPARFSRCQNTTRYRK